MRQNTKKYDSAVLVEEVKEYERKRRIEERCGMSTVQSVNCIVLNGVVHAGVVTHVCRKKADHEGQCNCCGYSWKGSK